MTGSGVRIPLAAPVLHPISFLSTHSKKSKRIEGEKLIVKNKGRMPPDLPAASAPQPTSDLVIRAFRRALRERAGRKNRHRRDRRDGNHGGQHELSGSAHCLHFPSFKMSLARTLIGTLRECAGGKDRQRRRNREGHHQRQHALPNKAHHFSLIRSPGSRIAPGIRKTLKPSLTGKLGNVVNVSLIFLIRHGAVFQIRPSPPPFFPYNSTLA